MVEVGRFFDAVSYTESDQAEVQARMMRDGVIIGVGSELSLSIAAGIVSVQAGEAWVQGFWYKNTATKMLAISSNASATARVDLIVLHLDRNANTIIATVHQGTVGSGAPALTQNGSDWEILLATVSTASSVSTLTDARIWQSNLYSPMTTLDDIIVADAHGNAVRKAKGTSNTVFGVNPSGVLGYYNINPMTTVGDLSVGGAVVSGVATPSRLALGSIGSSLSVNTSGVLSYNKTARLAVSYQQASNVYNGVSVTGGVGYPLLSPAPSFVVSSTSYIYEIQFSGMCEWSYGVGAGAAAYVTLQIDGVDQRYVGNGTNANAGVVVMQLLNTSVKFTGLSVGTHNTNLAIYFSGTGSLLYFRPASTPYEQLQCTVTEWPA